MPDVLIPDTWTGGPVRRRVLWSLMVGLAVVLVLLIVRHDAGTIDGLDQDFGSLVYKIVLLVVAGSMVLALFRHRFTEAVTAALLRSEEHTSELQSRFGISYAVF